MDHVVGRRRKRLFLLLPLLALTLTMVAPQVHADSTLFFDDFVGQGQPTQWASVYSPSDLGNVTQIGGYADINQVRGTFFLPTRITANQSSPVIGPLTSDGQSVFMVWKMYPFNITTPPGPFVGLNPSTLALSRVAFLNFGLRQGFNASSLAASEITFKLIYQDNAGQFSNITQKSGVFASISHPMNTTASCFDSAVTWGGVGATLTASNACQSTGVKGMVSYTTSLAPIDLSISHTFIIFGKFYPKAHTSWVAFGVDSMAWLNMTQVACSCIDQTAAGGSYTAMYPYISQWWFSECYSCSSSQQFAQLDQSLGTFVDYVLVDDFIPAALPVGQILSSPVKPPTVGPIAGPSNQCVGTSGGLSLVQCLQFTANSFGAGNLYLGGFLLELVMVMMPSVVIGWALGRVGFEGSRIWFTGMWGLFMILLGAYAGILPLWEMLLVFLLAIGAMMGLYGTSFNLGFRKGGETNE